MSNQSTPLALEGRPNTPAEKAPGFDLQLFNAGETIELLSQLLAVALKRLGGRMEVKDADIKDAITGAELGHGWNNVTDSYTVALIQTNPHPGAPT